MYIRLLFNLPLFRLPLVPIRSWIYPLFRDLPFTPFRSPFTLFPGSTQFAEGNWVIRFAVLRATPVEPSHKAAERTDAKQQLPSLTDRKTADVICRDSQELRELAVLFTEESSSSVRPNSAIGYAISGIEGQVT